MNKLRRPHDHLNVALGHACRCTRMFVVWMFIGIAIAICTASPAMAQGLTPEEIDELKQTELPTDPTELLAIVGDSPVLVGELLPKVDARIASLAKGDISQIPPEELRIVRLKLLRGLLTQTIQTKMLGHAFLMDRVGSSSKEQRVDAQKQIETKARNAFYEEEIPRMMKELEVDSLQALDTKLREKSSSVEFVEKEYSEQMLSQVYLREFIPRDPKITLNEIRLYYKANLQKFDQPAKARWEQLTVLFEKFPNRETAMAAISEMGNAALFGGNVQQVAREKSQEPLASSGGVHDWTRKGSLASKALDQQIFSLPVNRLSQIIEDETGFHIIRVLERTEAGISPLGRVQDEIRTTLQKEKVAEAQKKLLAKIKKDVPVYSRYPQDVDEAMPLEQNAALNRRLR